MKIPLKIKVHPVVKEFYLSTLGTDVIEIKQNDDFSVRIKTILQLAPKEYKRKDYEHYETLTLLIPNFRVGNKRINNLYRVHLDDRRQYHLSKELYLTFKGIFHNYVLAYCRAGGKQKEGINDFCTVYNLKMDRINFEMLKKSWDRSDEKKSLKSGSHHVPR